MAKPFCTCEKMDYIFRPLPEIPGPIFVHAPCGLPTRLVWENYIKRCETCLRLFSNPWESNCLSCFKDLIEYKELEPRIYNSWTWASKLVYSWDFQRHEEDPALCASLSLSMRAG